jgi:hypothetical protein
VTAGIHADEFGLDAGSELDLARIAQGIAASGEAPTAVIAHFRW